MANGRGGAHYDVSTDGTLGYWTGQDGFARRRRLFWAEPGGKRTSISEKLRNYLWPAIAPDGKRLAVTIFEQGNWDVWVHDLERDSQTRLTSHDGSDFGSVWSPDGRWVAFCSQRDGRNQIYRQMADGSGQAERLLESQYDQGPTSFSPDGKYLLFVRSVPDKPWDIWVLELDGERKTEVLANSSFDENSAVFSPNGRWVAYQSNESGGNEIYVRAFSGRGVRRQISTKGGESPRWSRDGRRLFYRVEKVLMSVVVRIDQDELQVEVPQVVVQTDDVFSGGWDWDVTPDGKRFVLIRDEESSGPPGPTLMKFTFHWFEELKRLVPKK